MKKYRFAIIVAAIILLVGIVIGTAFFLSSDHLPPEPDTPEQNRAFSHYYNSLDDKHKCLYNYICEAAEKFDSHTDELPYGFDLNDLSTVCYCIKADRPDLFYIDYDNMEMSHSVSICSVSLEYIDSEDRINEMSVAYSAQIELFKAEINDNMSTFEKEVAVNDYICRTCKRSSEENKLHNTAYGALVLKSAYCDGYSYAAKALFDACGIDSYTVFGTAGEENHVWNLVNTDNGYAHLDVMWNDADIEDSLQFHGYFNLNDTKISKDHTVFTDYKIIPDASGAVDYYDTKQLHIATVSELEGVIYTELCAAVTENRTYIEIECDETKENSEIAPCFESARNRLNDKLGYEKVYEPFCIYEANKSNNKITIKIFLREEK